MAGHDITLRKRRFLEALVGGRSVTEAAKLAGVSHRTAYRYLDDPDVREALATFRRAALEGLADRLRTLGQLAAQTLEEAMRDPDAAWSPRIRAAEATLTHLLRLAEYSDLEARISELERRLDGR